MQRSVEPTGSPLGSSNPGIARVGYIISDVIRPAVGAENVVLLDAGDEMQGSLLSNLKKGEPTIDLFNFLGYQAATFGNHEFDWGQPTLISRTQQAQYPFVTANIVVSDSGSCDTAGWTTPSFAKPWITMTVGAPGNQAVLGIVGVTTQETPYITIASATQGLCFKDPAQAIIHYYDAIKAAGANTIIVLSHLGYTDGGYGYGFSVYGDQTLARKLVEAGKPVPLIIGGHSHTNLFNATVISGTTVVQAYYNGRKIGRADLTIDTTANTTVVSWQPITVSASISEDVAVKNRLATWTNDPAYQAQINQVIGYSNVDLTFDYNGDNMMGNLVDDAIYNDLNNDGNPANDVDMFFNNAGGIRSSYTSTVKPYTLTYGMMFNVLPFGNATIVGTMTGAQIQDLLNQSATLNKGAIQPAGIRYTFYRYTDTLPGPNAWWAWGAYNVVVYNRASHVWEPLVMTRTYKVGTNEFLAPAGQDGYIQFKYFANGTYWGDMLNSVNHWISTTYGTPATAYNGPNGDGLLDGRITRNGTDIYNPNDPTQVVPVTILHHNDSHGDLVDYFYRSVLQPGYTRLATLIKQERAHNTARTILLNGGDQIQGDAMMAFYKAAFTGKGADGTTLPVTLTVNPMMAAMNSMNYTAMTLGNHEFNFGHYIFTGTLGQANFPLLQANLYDNGQYGIAQVNVRPYIALTLPGPVGNVKLAVLGIGNHRVPQYELPSNIPGLTFTNPITEAQSRAPALKATNDAVVALTHIGFTTDPKSVEVDSNVDTNLAAQTTGIDAIIGSHSHTNPSTGQDPYKFLPTIVGAPDNTPVIINQAQSYNYYLGEVVLGLLPKAGGGYQVVSRAGRYIANTTSVPEDAATKAIVKPYDDFLTTYKLRVVGQTTVPIDALNAYITETNAANLQADASLWKLNKELSPTLHVDFHLSGAMTNQAIATTATVTTPYTMIINDMFTLMPYENSLVVFRLNGPQLKTILERGYRNYFYYKYVPGYGGYSHYTTCMIDTNHGAQIKYRDTYPFYPNGNNVASLTFDGHSVNFLDATTYYTVSTVNYIAAGSCNFNNGGVTIWPLNQIVADTQYYVRDVVVEYVPTLAQPISPAVEGRLQFAAFSKAVFLPLVLK
jgi:5'-nucleotidase/UDP-sugar diphosphatase